MIRSYLLIFFAALLFSSCDKNRLYEEYIPIDDFMWNRNKHLTFRFDISDTLISYNIYLNLRHRGDYKYSNIFLFINTQGPDSMNIRDTIDFPLANEKGKWHGKKDWLGTGIGDLFDNRLIYKKNVIFPKKGTYTIEIEQAMREIIIESVSDVGVRVEKN
jgi:gliding motility-associated lipoprotein GldH